VRQHRTRRLDPVEIASITIRGLAELAALTLFIGAVGFWSAVWIGFF
jgi:hypothetical protein